MRAVCTKHGRDEPDLGASKNGEVQNRPLHTRMPVTRTSILRPWIFFEAPTSFGHLATRR